MSKPRLLMLLPTCKLVNPPPLLFGTHVASHVNEEKIVSFGEGFENRGCAPCRAVQATLTHSLGGVLASRETQSMPWKRVFEAQDNNIMTEFEECLDPVHAIFPSRPRQTCCRSRHTHSLHAPKRSGFASDV